MSDIAYVKDGVTHYTDGLASQPGPSPLLRAAIEKIGIEKPSDYTLVLEEVGRMEAEEKLVERVALAIWQDRERRFPGRVQRLSPDDIDKASGTWENTRSEARASIEASGLLAILTASEAFIKEAEEMGWGKTSDKAYPGSFDLLLKAVREMRG